jgi:two-component system, chemotaxis family, protein-glutamate methylesterase/glutaminase
MAKSTIARSKINILVVDDSLFMRAAIKKLLDARPEFHVIDMARDGQEGIEKALALHPDVITMDFNMPRMNGVQAVREIMRQCPTPVLMFSAHTRKGAKETFDALHAGAFDFVTKPAGEVSAHLDGIADELCRKLSAAARSRPGTPAQSRPPGLRTSRTMSAVSPRARTTETMAVPSLRASRSQSTSILPRVVVVGISTGGPVALSRVIPLLPASLRVAVIVVQHMPAAFTAILAERLSSESQVEVREAQDGDRPRAGTVLIAPGGKHLSVDSSGILRLTDGPLVHGCRPAADVTMKSAAAAYGRRAIGVVMTGMGKDAAEGLAAIKAASGKTFAQDKDSCVIFGMPKAAIDLGVVDEIIALDDIASKLSQL